MDTIKELNSNITPAISFKDCESAYSLIKAGKEKQAEQQFPLEYYLIQKYLYIDMHDLSALLEMKLTVNG